MQVESQTKALRAFGITLLQAVTCAQRGMGYRCRTGDGTQKMTAIEAAEHICSVIRESRAALAATGYPIPDRWNCIGATILMRHRRDELGAELVTFPNFDPADYQRVRDEVAGAIDSLNGRLATAAPDSVISPGDFPVTLKQACMLAGLGYESIRHRDDLPIPDLKGDNGAAHKYKWVKMRDYLAPHTTRRLPERFPADTMHAE